MKKTKDELETELWAERKHVAKLQSDVSRLETEKLKAEISRDTFKVKHKMLLDDWKSLRQMLRMLARDEDEKVD